ncbi:MAG: hypothetical protein ABJN42_15025 [Roseibium sp.]
MKLPSGKMMLAAFVIKTLATVGVYAVARLNREKDRSADDADKKDPQND